MNTTPKGECLAGAGHYAAANSVLDGMASARQYAGLPSTALQLGPFGETGMAAQHAQQLASLGLHGLKPSQVPFPHVLLPSPCTEAKQSPLFLCFVTAGIYFLTNARRNQNEHLNTLKMSSQSLLPIPLLSTISEAMSESWHWRNLIS